MSDLHQFSDGSFLALRDDGERGRKIAPGDDVPSGWHLLTEAEYGEHVDDLIGRAVDSLIEHDPTVRAKYRVAYLDQLRQSMSKREKVELLRDREGAVLFGYRFWGALPLPFGDDELAVIFDGLDRFAREREVYVFLCEDDEDSNWIEAWRVSDRKLVQAGSSGQVMDALMYAHRPRTRG